MTLERENVFWNDIHFRICHFLRCSQSFESVIFFQGTASFIFLHSSCLYAMDQIAMVTLFSVTKTMVLGQSIEIQADILRCVHHCAFTPYVSVQVIFIALTHSIDTEICCKPGCSCSATDITGIRMVCPAALVPG